MKKIIRTLSGLVLMVCMLISLTGCMDGLKDEGLRIGWAMEDVTPDGPVSLKGQYYERISEYVHTPLKVTALAIESASERGTNEQAIMISMDFVAVSTELQSAVRQKIAVSIPGIDANKVFLNATHTHSAPFPTPSDEYGILVIEKTAKAAMNAWNNRKPAGISRVFSHAVVGHNRRVRYADGSTEMYGSVDREDFIGLEGPTDPGVDMLFCWDLNKKMTGILMNVSCPAQVTEAKYYVSSDYWGELREEIKNSEAGNVFVFSQCGAGGDISPRNLPAGYKAGEPNMWDIPGAKEIAYRLARVIDEAYPEARKNIQTNPVVRHISRNIELRTRMITEEEYKKAAEVVSEIRSREPADPDSPDNAWNRFLRDIKENEKLNEYGPWDNKLSDFGQLKPNEAIIKKYETQQNNSLCNIEVHVLRLGDIVIATNPFELYVDYGLSITARSKAKQTFIVQLCSGASGYLPTERAIRGGGYSAMITDVGPEGGQQLVNLTVEMIDETWK